MAALKTRPPHMSAKIRLAQHCVAISAIAEFFFPFSFRYRAYWKVFLDRDGKDKAHQWKTEKATESDFSQCIVVKKILSNTNQAEHAQTKGRWSTRNVFQSPKSSPILRKPVYSHVIIFRFTKRTAWISLLYEYLRPTRLIATPKFVSTLRAYVVF